MPPACFRTSGYGAAAIGQHSKELQSAHDDCPVCRRPLNPETIGHAKSAHAAELARIAAETEQLRSDERRAVARHEQVRCFAMELRILLAKTFYSKQPCH